MQRDKDWMNHVAFCRSGFSFRQRPSPPITPSIQKVKAFRFDKLEGRSRCNEGEKEKRDGAMTKKNGRYGAARPMRRSIRLICRYNNMMRNRRNVIFSVHSENSPLCCSVWCYNIYQQTIFDSLWQQSKALKHSIDVIDGKVCGLESNRWGSLSYYELSSHVSSMVRTVILIREPPDI